MIGITRMDGSLDSLRDKWIEKRLIRLYQGNNPNGSIRCKGIRFLAIDNSTYEINDKQLNFSKHVRIWYAYCFVNSYTNVRSGKNISFGCGNPFLGELKLTVILN